jgi:hypothetical protein
MTSVRVLLALAGLAIGAADLPAQGFFGPSGYAGFGFSYSGFRGRRGLSLSFNRTFVGYGGYGGFGYGYGYGAFAPQVSIAVYTPPPILFAPPRMFLDDPDIAMLMRPDVDLLPRLRQPLDPLLPGGAPAGGFRPRRPDERADARRAMPPDVPPPIPPDRPRPRPPERPAPKVDKPPELPKPPRPEADPQAESARLIALGRAAFAAQEYGRASERFRQAARVARMRAPGRLQAPRPGEDPLPHFLLGQALFALGNYREAVEAIQAGLTLRPEWPTVRFVPLELYGPNPGDWTAHLRRLEDVRLRHPNDPVLLFLNAYELWFDGRKDEARALFRRARPGAADPTFIDRFLRPPPAI